MCHHLPLCETLLGAALGPEERVGGRREEGDELVRPTHGQRSSLVTGGSLWDPPAHAWLTGQPSPLGCRVWEAGG